MRLTFLILILQGLILACRQDGGKQPNADPPGIDTLAEGTDSTQALIAEMEESSRVAWQKPDLVMDRIGNLEGKTIADLGAGSGFFSIRMAARGARVIAIDIDQRMLQHIDSLREHTLRPEEAARIVTRLAGPDDPRLAPEEADAILLVNTYIYLQNRTAYFSNLRKSIRPGGRLVIVDYKAQELPVGPPSGIKLSPAAIEQELRQAGYQQIVSDTGSLQYQYIITAFPSRT